MNNINLLTRSLLVAATAVTSLSATPAAAVVVPSNQFSDTIVGQVTNQQSYIISIGGNSTLCTTCNGGSALTFDSNGIPTTTPVGGYAGFAPNGSRDDPSTGALDYGKAPAFNLGALVFIFADTNGGAVGSPFSLQNGATFTASTTGTLNAFVNDTDYRDNAATGFTVSFRTAAVTPDPVNGAVPEPATWAMMILGLGAVGGTMRRRRVRTSVRFA